MKEFSEEEVERLLFQELQKQPPVTLSPEFSGKVVARLTRKTRPAMAMIYFLLLLLGVAGVGVAILYFFGNMQQLTESMEALLPYKWVVLFILLFLVLIQYFDQELIRRKIPLR